MNRATTSALAVLLCLGGCATTGKYSGPALPPDPGPGFLYIRVVTGDDLVSYAAIVYVEDKQAARVLKVVGPVDDWPAFFGMARATYALHGAGEPYCSKPSGPPCPSYEAAPARAPMPPPRPPPPMGGYALSYSKQPGSVNPDTIGQPAADAAGAAVNALGQ